MASLFLREDPDEEGGVSAGSQDQAACLEGGVTWGEEGRAGAQSGLVLFPCRAHSLGAERWDKPVLLPLERRPLEGFPSSFQVRSLLRLPPAIPAEYSPSPSPARKPQQGRPQSSFEDAEVLLSPGSSAYILLSIL